MKLFTLIFTACLILLFTTDAQSQTVQKSSLSAFSIVSNDTVTVVSGQSMSGESLNPRILHGYLPFQYSTLDILENAIENEISLYPNPVQETLTVSFSLDGHFDLFLYSMDGKLQLTQSLAGNVQLIEMSNLADGLYILKVKDEKGNQFEEKVLKH